MMARLNPGWYMKTGGQGEQQTNEFTELGLKIYRKPDLERFHQYLENRQYDDMPSIPDNAPSGSRMYAPRKSYPLVGNAAKQIASYICDEESLLTLSVQETTQQEALNDFIEDIDFWETLECALPSFFVLGSMFIAFQITNNRKVIISAFPTKYCWPKFDENDDLEEVIVRFIYRTTELSADRKPVFRWFQYKYGKNENVTYNEPLFDKAQTEVPLFKPVDVEKHNMGFVQGEWVKTTKDPLSDDGESLIKDYLPYIDDFIYMDSREAEAIYYNLFAMLALFNTQLSDADFKDKDQQYQREVIQQQMKNVWGGSKALQIPMPPQQADIRFIESAMAASAHAAGYQQEAHKRLQWLIGVTQLDPDRIATHAQSGKALEALFKPMVQFIKKCRRPLKRTILSFLEKIAVASDAIPADLITSAKAEWGQIFQDTGSDKQVKIAYTSMAKESGLISHLSAIKYVAKDFNITNAEAELELIKEDQQNQIEQESAAFKDQEMAKQAAKPQPKTPANKGK